MADNARYGNAVDFDVDLHSIYAAFLGLFESSGIDWWDKSWGGYFTSFGDFLGFGWEVMVVVDGTTGRPHIAVRRDHIGLFAKMIRTRFGESLPKDPPTTLPLDPVATRNLSFRRLVILSDLAQYRKLSLTLPAAQLSHLRTRLRSGEVEVAEQLFYAGGSTRERERGGVGVRDNGVGYTWACVQTTWWDKGGPPHGLVPGSGRTQGGKGLILEVGMAVIRCANLRAVNVWPPTPEENYRKSHFVMEEWVDKRVNSNPPNYPRAYAFGRSRYVSDKNVERIIEATVGALASQESDLNANTLILLTAGEALPLPVPAPSTLPSNILHLDVLALEYRLLRQARDQGIPGTPNRDRPLTSLASLLQILQIPVPPFAPLGNAGNEAYYTVLAFQKLMMAETRLPNLLFQQPPIPMGYPYPSYAAQHFSRSPTMPLFPPPVPPFVGADRPRRGSDQSKRGQQNEVPSLLSHRVTSDTRTRPASWGANLAQQAKAVLPDRPDTPDDYPQPESAPATVRQTRQTTSRAQTVFLDSSGTPQSSNPSSSGQRNSSTSILSGRSEGRERPSMLPGSSLQGMSGTPRSVSWDSKSIRLPQGQSSSQSQSAASSPRRGIRPQLASGASTSSLSKDGGMALSKHSSGSDSKSNLDSKVREIADSTGEAEKKGKDKGKLKNEKSVKDLAGALAKFWVG